MRVIKKIAKKTYVGNDKKEHHYVNYYLEADNGKRILIKTVNVDDIKRLDMISVFEASRNNEQ